MRARAGYAFTELVVTLALSAVVAAALGSVLLTHLRVARIIAARTSAADATRLALHVLATEFRLASPAADIHASGRDSIAARLPRLSGTVCALGPGRIWVRASGMREPDPSKDSVLLVSGVGERATALAGLTEEAGPCPPASGQTVYRLDWTPAPERGGAVLVFENGSYFLRERALRLRMGGEGRQPLTEEVFLDAGSGFVLRSDSGQAGLEVRLLAAKVFGEALALPVRSVIRFPNVLRQ